MPTLLSHPAVPLALGLGLGRQAVPARLLAAGAVASALPDLDVIAFRFGVPYSAQLGHRGFSHSLMAAALVGLIGAIGHRWLGVRPRTALAFLFAATALSANVSETDTPVAISVQGDGTASHACQRSFVSS
jgi:inner membrane protein